MMLQQDNIQDIARLLIYMAQADGVITPDEIKYFDDYFKVRTGDESLFSRITADAGLDKYRVIQKTEVIEGLSGKHISFQIISILDAFGLAMSDRFEYDEKKILVDLCLSIGFDDKILCLIEKITGLSLGCPTDYPEIEIISIGNNCCEHDICVNGYSISAKIFLLEGKMYFFGLDSQGSVLLNDSRILFNGIVTEIRDGDYLNLGRFKLYYPELMRRISRKVNRSIFTISLVYDASGSKLILNDEDSMVRPDVSLFIEGNICTIESISDRIGIFADNTLLERGSAITIGMDQHIVIRPVVYGISGGSAGFNLDIPALLNSLLSRERISIDGSERVVKNISNNDTSADIFLESIYTTEKEKFVDICVEIDRVSTLRIENMGSTVFLNGEPVEERIVSIDNGDLLQIEKEIISFDFDKGTITNVLSRINRVDVTGLTYKYRKDESGINDITFSSRLGEMVCIMGPSGSGKSSLIKVMLGYHKASSGSITLNGLDFYDNFNTLKNYVGYVPQDDLLYENLTVFDNLYYSGKLKLPHISEKQLIDKIDDLLVVLGLSEKKDKIVGSELKRTLSGGERRRLNIGLELLNDADVIYLDEPTSGLSSYDSKKIIELLKSYAGRGKIIYVVIHQPAPEIFYMFDTLILLDYGGKLVYYGNTDNAVSYFTSKNQRIVRSQAFDNQSPDVILEILQEVKRDLNGNVITETDASGNRVPARVCSPHSWKSIFEDYRKNHETIDELKPNDTDNEKLKYKKETLKHRLIRFKSLFMRNFKDRIKDRSSVAMALLAPLLLVLVLSFLMRTGSAPALIGFNEYNRIAGIILENENKGYYDDNTALLLKSYIYNNKGYYNLSDRISPEAMKHLKEIYLSPAVVSLMKPDSVMDSSYPLESVQPELYTKILRAVFPYESEFYTFLKYYNSFDSTDHSVAHKYITSENDKENDKNDKKDIHKIFRDDGIDKYLFKQNANFPKFLFLSVIILIFLGITSSINEIQKDRPKIQREKLLNIRAFDYLLSKSLTTLIFSVLQTAIYVTGAILIIKLPFAVPELNYSGLKLIVSFFIISLLVMLASSMLGYFISSMVRSEKTIFIMIPVIMIPQIIFGGLFLTYDDMGGRLFQKDRPVPQYCDFMFSRWGYEGLVAVSSLYNPKNIMNDIINTYNFSHPGDNMTYTTMVENKYNKNMTIMYNDESNAEILNAIRKWSSVDPVGDLSPVDKSITGKLSVLYESHDPYPCTKKKVFSNEYSTTIYNSLVLIFFISVFYSLTLIVIKKERGI